ncbi:YHYH protein [Amaricoccus macauensis]|uniref:YHYH protein n=1 Tax=Amaricoccus macauensis TaxID=57001 RepID=UPI003C7E9CAF
MSNRALYLTAAASVLAAVGALQCSPLIAQDGSGGAPDTSAAIAGANWADTVTIAIDDKAETFRFQSNGIPSHGFAEKYLIPNDVGSMPFSDNAADEFTVVNSAEYFQETPIDATITTRPVYVEDMTDTALGRIGVAVSGAQIFNDYEDPERTIAAMDDNVIHDHVPFVDECNGHTLVDGTNYHYHGIPVCITADLDVAGEHSTMIGVLEDGFPVYGNQGAGGVTVTDADLDECSGHFGVTPEFPDGIYHYHLTADEAPYMIDCYHGEVSEALRAGRPGGGGPDFGAIATQLGITEAELMDALGTSQPPDFAAAAERLGIDEDDLRTAMPAPGGAPGQ